MTVSITMEDLDGLEFEVVKQKYYNANKVNAKLEELRPALAELITEKAELETKLAVLLKENAELLNEASVLREQNAELITKQEKLEKGLSEEDKSVILSAGNDLIAAAEQTANAVVAESEARAERIVDAAQTEAKRLLDEAKQNAADAAVSLPVGELSAAQLDLIEELNSQLDSLKTTQETQIFKLKQKLMSLAID